MAEKRNKLEVWDRQPEETPKAYEAFTIYRDMGRERTLPKVAEQCGKSIGLMNKWSQKYGWVNRVRAWDDNLDRMEAKELARDIAKMRARQRKQALKMQVKGLELMKDIQPGDARLSEIVSLMKLGMEQERIVMGDVGEVVEERDGGQAAPPVQFYMPSNGRDDVKITEALDEEE